MKTTQKKSIVNKLNTIQTLLEKCGGEGGTPGPCPTGAGKPSGDGKRSSKEVRQAVESVIGTFEAGHSRTIGNRTSSTKSIGGSDKKKQKELVGKLGESLSKLGFSKMRGKNANQTMWGTSGATHIVTAEKRKWDVLVEVVTTND